MGDFNWNTRMEITKKRNEALEKRIQHLKGKDRELAFLLKDGKLAGSQRSEERRVGKECG